MKELKFKNTKIEIERFVRRGAKMEKCPNSEGKLRNFCYAKLKKASEKKLKNVSFGPFEFDLNSLSPSAYAKIIAQEAYKHVKLTRTSLKRISIVLSRFKERDKLFKKGFLLFSTETANTPGKALALVDELVAIA